jgi:two-component system KDP operon response regulator KdpE
MPDGKSTVLCHGLVVDLVRCLVTVNEKNVRLTPVEYKIMKVLAKQQGEVLTYSQLLEVVKGKTEKKTAHYVQQYIAQVRQKIEDDPLHPRYIITERSVGYRLANQETAVKNK